jgi:hypothetical protein
MKNRCLLLCAAFYLLAVISVSGSSRKAATQNESEKKTRLQDTTKPSSSPTFKKAFVIDDRLSVLRRKPDLRGEVIRRLRVGHAVFIIGTPKITRGEPRFCRVAVSRRTRGWIHEAALAVPGHSGDDQRILKLIEATEGTDKITLCRLIIESFSRSRLVARSMLLLGEEADRLAEGLSQRIRRRLGEVRGAVAAVRDYYLSDAGLDRYSKLGVAFDFNELTGEFSYDGKAFREVIKRFPTSEEAAVALQRLEFVSKKISNKH